MIGSPASSATSTLTLVVPLFNEADRFPVHVGQLLAYIADQPDGSELLFVDDGSDDETPDLVEHALEARGAGRARLLRRPHRGKGAAVQAGLEAARGTVAAFCDLDLATPIPSLAEVIDAARRAPVVAIGSRDLVGSRLVRRESQSREFLGRTYNRVVQLVLTPGVLDTQCGAKAASMDVWRRILPACRERGFAWDVEVIAVALRLGIGVQELAIEWRHDDGSRLNMARDGAAMVAAIPRIWRTVGRVRPAGRRPESTQWWIRGTAAYLSAVLAPLTPSRGWLVAVGPRSSTIAGRAGWPLERTLAIESPTSPAVYGEATAVHALLGDSERIPLAGGSVQVVCLLGVLEGVEDKAALAEAARILAPDGKLIVTIPGHSKVTPPGAVLHQREALRRHLLAHGFDVDRASHTFGWLLPAALAGRTSSWVRSEPDRLPAARALADRLALVFVRLEVSVIRRLPLPVGTSIECVATARP